MPHYSTLATTFGNGRWKIDKFKYKNISLIEIFGSKQPEMLNQEVVFLANYIIVSRANVVKHF